MEKNIFPRPRLDARLSALRERAKEVRDPTAADDTLQYILFTLEQLNPARILEIGAAEGLTSCAMLLNSRAELTAIELDSSRAAKARGNFDLFGLSKRVTLHEGDAGEILPMIEGSYDLIFWTDRRCSIIGIFPIVSGCCGRAACCCRTTYCSTAGFREKRKHRKSAGCSSSISANILRRCARTKISSRVCCRSEKDSPSA